MLAAINDIEETTLFKLRDIDVKTSKELFGLMGGGIRINGEYVPVELTKVHEAILAQDDAPKH